MKNNFFLDSYDKLEEVFQNSEKILTKIFNNDWGNIKHQISLLAINKFRDDDKLRINSNDYFYRAIKINRDFEKGDFNIDEKKYNNAVKQLLVITLKSKTIVKIIKYENLNILKVETLNEYFLLENSKIFQNKFLKEKNKTIKKNKLISVNEIINIDYNEAKDLDTWIYSKDNIKILSLYTLIRLNANKNSLIENIITNEKIKFFEKNGYFIIENFIDKVFTEKLKSLTYKIANTQRRKNKSYTYGKNNNLQRIYNLIGKSNLYLKLILDKRIELILENFFQRDTLHAKYYLSSYQANILYPGAESQILHTDLAIPEPLPPWPIRLNININLDEFTIKNGATLVIPGSHKYLKKPDPFMKNLKFKKLIAPAGSLIIWTGHLWHKSGKNSSKSPRAALLACFAASYMREIAVEENYFCVNDPKKIKKMPSKIFKLIGGNHGVKASA